MNVDQKRTSVGELALLFLRLGATTFGGPAAHIAMMRDECVRRRGWMSDERFLDLVSATNLIPGPNSTEMAIHIGWQRRGWTGLVVAGLCFILPAMLMTGVCAWLYVRFGTVPAASWLLYGVKPMILGVVVQAIWGLAPHAARNRRLVILGAASATLTAFGVNEIGVLLGAGIASMLIARLRSGLGQPTPTTKEKGGGALHQLLPAVPVAGLVATAGLSLSSLFWVFLKAGSLLFGSGYVLLAFLRADLVQRLGWLTEGQLIDAVAIGQITPGPVFTTATFIGYQLLGIRGALVATAGIFLPAFVFVALSGPVVPRLRSSRWAAAFLDGVNVASLALMAVVTVHLGRAALVDVPTAALGLVGAGLLIRFRPNATWIVLGGAAAGFLLYAAGWVRP